MGRKHDCWGIEVGADAIKAIRLVRHGSEVELADHDLLPFKHILTTPDINVNEAIQVNLDLFMQRHDVRKSQVWISVPGHTAFARFATLPPVEPKKIPDIVRYEAVQQIPFPIDQVEWDYQTFLQEDSPDVKVGIFAMGRERLESYLNNYRAVGLNIDGVTLSPIAMLNAMMYDLGQSGAEETLLVDVGASSTDVVIASGGSVWLRTLPIGGNDFTEALVKAFKLSFPKAEKLKREAATSKYARQIFQAMRPVFADLVQEMQRSLGYYQSIDRDAQLNKIIGVGSTFRLPGLQKFLKQQLRMDVQRLDKLQRLEPDDKRASEFADQTLNMATAYGLALQGLGLAYVSPNLLPAYVIRRRLWRAKQPWFAAAAALVVVATGWNAATLLGAKGTFDESELLAVGRVVKEAGSLRSQWDELLTADDTREPIEKLRRLLDYRTVWPLLLEDIASAAKAMSPQPETLGADYQQLGKIPRDERRRVYISQISANYVVGPVQSKDAAWTENPWTEGVQAPSFVINIKGTMPHKEGVSLFSETFIKWLRENAERADRPYRILLKGTRNPVLEFAKIGESSRRSSSGSSRRADSGALDLALRNLTRPSFGSTGGTGRLGVGTGGSTTVEQVLPSRPLQDESTANDWRFEIEWTVELLPPEQARQSELRVDPGVEPGVEQIPEGKAAAPGISAGEGDPLRGVDREDRS